MKVSPRFYNMFVHPQFITKLYAKKLSSYADISGKRLLDFGCGTGNNAGIFDPEQYLGVDIDSERISYARTLNPTHTFQVVGEQLDELEDSSFDRILISAVLHHIEDSKIAGYLAHFKRILKPDGQIIIYEPFLAQGSRFRNWHMNTFDEGDFIRTEKAYLAFFEGDFVTTVHFRANIAWLYNGLFFSVSKKEC